MPVSSRTSRTAVAGGFSPGSTRPLGSVNRARVRLRGVVVFLVVSFCSLCGSIRATCQAPEIWRRTTPPAEISRGITQSLSRINDERVATGLFPVGEPRHHTNFHHTNLGITTARAYPLLLECAAMRVPHGEPGYWSARRTIGG